MNRIASVNGSIGVLTAGNTVLKTNHPRNTQTYKRIDHKAIFKYSCFFEFLTQRATTRVNRKGIENQIAIAIMPNIRTMINITSIIEPRSIIRSPTESMAPWEFKSYFRFNIACRFLCISKLQQLTHPQFQRTRRDSGTSI